MVEYLPEFVPILLFDKVPPGILDGGVVGLEGGMAGDHDEIDDSEGEYVALLEVEVVGVVDLGGVVAFGASD